MNILDHPAPISIIPRLSRTAPVSVPFTVHSAGAPFAVAAFRDRESRRRIRRGAVPSCQPSVLDCFACLRPRVAKAPRPRLHGLQHRDLALLPLAVAPHPQVEDVQAATVAGVGIRIVGPSLIVPGQFRVQPAQDWMCRSVSIVDPLTWRPLGWAVCTHHMLDIACCQGPQLSRCRPRLSQA